MVEALAQQLVHWCTEVKWADVPPDQHNLIRLRLLDTLGLIFTAIDSPQGKSAWAFVQHQGGPPESTLIGSRNRLPAAWTALAHGILAHSHDFDDTFVESVIHPGSVIIPVALAVGEATAASGEEIMLAIAIGYEIAARLGSGAGRKFHARGFHPTGVIGPLAAAVTAAKLYKLSVAATTNALGIAGSMSSGLLEFLSDGSWSKWLHPGWAAHGGIVAAQFASYGFSGPASVLDGHTGLYNTFLGEGMAKLESVVIGLGQDWLGAEAHFKHYPCAHVIQPYIDAASRLRTLHNLSPQDIAEVRCVVAPWCVPLVCEPRVQRLRPQTSLHAIASLPFLVAVALVNGTVTLKTISTPQLENSAVFDLAERIWHVEDRELGASFDGRLEIRMADGRELVIPAVLSQRDNNKVRVKFRQNVVTSRCSGDVDALEKIILDDVLDAKRMFSLISTMQFGTEHHS